MTQHPGSAESLRILLIGEDGDSHGPVRRDLVRMGFETWSVRDHSVAERMLSGPSERDAALVLIAVDVPRPVDLEFLCGLRGRGEDVPVGFLTKSADADQRVHVLELGADDCLVQPIEPAELAARIRAVIRRYAGPTIEIGVLRLESRRGIARFGGERIDLSPMEFTFLRALAEREGQCLSHRQLLDKVWGISFDPGTNLVAVHVGRLRRKLGKERQGVVRTVHGLGYRLDIGFLDRGERAG